MSYEIPILSWGTNRTGADLSGSGAAAGQYTFVKFNGSGNIIQCNTQGEVTVGVLQNKPASGFTTDIMSVGVSKVYAGSASITKGQQLMVDTSGRAIPATTGNQVVGISLAATANVNEIIPVLLTIGGGKI